MKTGAVKAAELLPRPSKSFVTPVGCKPIMRAILNEQSDLHEPVSAIQIHGSLPLPYTLLAPDDQPSSSTDVPCTCYDLDSSPVVSSVSCCVT